MRAAIYIRVSSDEQAEQGFSLDGQLSSLTSYCASQGWDVHDTYMDDGYSAKDTNRPALQRLLSDIKIGVIEAVVVWRLDRLTRSVLNLHEMLNVFEKHNVIFKSATEIYDTGTAMGRLFVTIIGAIAEWERANLAERVKMGMIEMTKQGKWSGGTAPFGYRREDGKLVIYEPEAIVVREIFKRYCAGIGYVKLLQWLNDERSPQLAPRERWTQAALKYILRNPLYAGNVRFGYRDPSGKRKQDYIIAPGEHDAIVPQDIFDQAEDVRKRRRTNPGRSNGNYVLSGILRCGLCGSAMNGWTKYRTNKNEGPPIRYYQCNERAHSRLCKMPMIKAEVIEQMVLERLGSQYREQPTELAPEEKKPEVNLSAELAKINRQRDRWKKAFAEEDITSKMLREELAKLDKQEMQLRALYETEKESTDPNELRAIIQTLRESWDVMEPVARKTALQLLIEQITLDKEKQIQIVYRG